MTPKEKEALNSIKEDLYNYPETIMITVSRRELELIINYIDKENKKVADRRQAKSVTEVITFLIF